MKKSEYLDRAFKAHNEGKISDEVYDAILLNADHFVDEEEEIKTYTITIAQIIQGNIKVEATNREEAKEMALKLAKENCNNVAWFDGKFYRIDEVYEMKEGN